MCQFAIQEVDRRILAKKTLVAHVEHQAEEKFKERVEEIEGKVAILTHELKESNEHREDLKRNNERLEIEIAALRVTLESDSETKDAHISNKSGLQEEILELQS